MHIQSGSAQSHDAHWFPCASQCAFAKPPPEGGSMRLAFDPVSRVDHEASSERLRNVIAWHADANSTQRVGLVERSLLLSLSCFRRSRAQLNNKRTASTASVNVGHFVTRSSCVTTSTYDVHCPRISKTSVNMIDALPIRFHLMRSLMRIKCEHALTMN